MKKSIQEININQPNCPFCNSPQPFIDSSFSNHHFRSYCSCNKMQEHIRHLKEMNELEDKLLSLDNRLQVQRKKSEKLLYESGIGKRFLNASFDNFDRKREPQVYDVAKQYVESFPMNDGKGLIFTGGVGTGKTHLAAAICREVISRYSTTVEFVSYVQLLADIRAAFSNHSEEAYLLEERMRKADLLVIDDLGKEKPSPFTNELFYRVVNGRYKDRLPMIITSNYGVESLSERLDYPVFSRLAAICRAVEMRGIDYRMKDYLC